MSTTFGALKTAVSSALRDPDNRTFSTSAVGELVNAGVAEVSRILPKQFQENITPVADTLEYTVLADVFTDPNPEVEVARVEIWDGSTTPDEHIYTVPPASGGYTADSNTGWSLWGGTLYLPRSAWSVFDGNEDTYLLRVWGYCPYPQMDDDADTCDVTADGYWAVIAYAQVEALQRLLNERDLFSQWQTRAGNSDISPAGLMNALNIARDEWRRRSRALMRLRAAI